MDTKGPEKARRRINMHGPGQDLVRRGRVRKPGQGKIPEENLRNEGTLIQTVDIKCCLKSLNVKERITLLK